MILTFYSDLFAVLDVIVCSTKGCDNEERCSLEEELKEILDDWRIVSVPKTQPKTRQQFEEARLLWPVAFHEDKRCVNLSFCVFIVFHSVVPGLTFSQDLCEG